VRVRVRAAPPESAPPYPAGAPSAPPYPAGAPSAPPYPAGAAYQPGPPPFGPPTQLDPAQFGPVPPPQGATAPPRRRGLLVGGAVAAVLALVACCGVPAAVLLSQDDPKPNRASNGANTTATVEPSPSAGPLSPDQYQALLAEVDRSLVAGFGQLGAARNTKAIRAAASELETAIDAQYRTLAAAIPPENVTAAHDDLVDAMSDMDDSVSEIGSSASLGDVCLGPAAMSRVSRAEATDRVRSASLALAAADRERAYQVGSFLPQETNDGNRRLTNGTYVKRARGGRGQLKINNSSGDTVISVVRNGSKTPAIRVYVRSKNSFTVFGVKDGTYRIFMASGRDWNTKLRAFSFDCGFQKFDDSFRFTTTSSTYTGWTISLKPTVGGNARTSPVDPDEFPGG
jgi:hypothetical protein